MLSLRLPVESDVVDVGVHVDVSHHLLVRAGGLERALEPGELVEAVCLDDGHWALRVLDLEFSRVDTRYLLVAVHRLTRRVQLPPRGSMVTTREVALLVRALAPTRTTAGAVAGAGA